MRRLLVLSAAAFFAHGCTCGPSGSALAIKVDFDSTSLSQCAIVSVASAKARVNTAALKRPTDNQLIVGVEPTPELSGSITPSVQGFATANCTGAAIEEASAPALNLDAPGRQEVTLTLRGSPKTDGGAGGGGGSGGGGGGAAGGGGGSGGDGGCTPATELCQDALDNDCDGLVDCLDPSCAALACTDNNACTSTDVCLADGGCGGAPVLCTTPGTCELAPGQCLAGVCGYDAGVGLTCNGGSGICKSDKTCADAGAEVFCANNVDDDVDLAIDCADSDCNGQACDAGPSTCFAATSCLANACAKIDPVVCSPPSPCFVSTGACVEGAGCPFALLDAGTPCPTGFCRADGGCTPQEVCTNGTDDDGDTLADCADPDCNALACTDANACTSGTTCQAGVCGGGTLCPAISSCTGVGTCGTDGGCQYTVATFSKCDGGFCRPNGTCGSPFPFTPSNFDPNALSVPDAGVSLNCLAEYDSTPGAAMNGFAAWCGPQPFVFTLPQGTGGEDIDVMVAPQLVVTDAGALYLTGTRPVVLAVFGNATIDGRIVAGPRPGQQNTRGAGGSLTSVLAKSHCVVGGMTGRGADGASSNNTSGGGGGGAFGLAGGNGGPGAGQSLSSGGTGGAANGNATLIPLRGGCPGGLGGNNYLGGPAAGGFGGGAVQMSVGGALLLSGYLSAPGLPGEGGNNNNNANAGGGGAGSGGAILLEAGQLQLFSSAAVTAHGGGGGEGDGDPQGGGEAGNDGQAGHVTDASPALGGIGGSNRGGNGGQGGVLATNAFNGDGGTSGSSRNGGGGGGGASVGRIRLNIAGQCRVDAGSLISPQFTGSCP